MAVHFVHCPLSTLVKWLLMKYASEGPLLLMTSLLMTLKVRKNTRRGGGLNCVLKNFFVPYVEVMFSGSESEEVQSLSEFRVVCSG